MADGSSRIAIDVGEATTSGELHAVLKQALGFPDFYGMNWDAFWDSITGLVEIPDRITFSGWSDLTSRLPRDAELLRKCLDDYQRLYRENFEAVYE